MSMVQRFLGRFSRGPEPEVNDGKLLVGIPATRPPSIQELVQRYVREALSPAAVAEGKESFEEADDFEEDDPDVVPMTHHEVAALTDEELRGIATGYGVPIADGEAPQEGRSPKERHKKPQVESPDEGVDSQAPQE